MRCDGHIIIFVLLSTCELGEEAFCFHLFLFFHFDKFTGTAGFFTTDLQDDSISIGRGIRGNEIGKNGNQYGQYNHHQSQDGAFVFFQSPPGGLLERGRGIHTGERYLFYFSPLPFIRSELTQ